MMIIYHLYFYLPTVLDFDLFMKPPVSDLDMFLVNCNLPIVSELNLFKGIQSLTYADNTAGGSV